MATDSIVRITEYGQWSFNHAALKAGMRSEGQNIARVARRYVSRNAVSTAGEFAGKDSGRLRQTLKSKLYRNGMGVVITHVMRNGEDRYPFMLGYGTKHVKSRKDHIAQAMNAQRGSVAAMLQSSFKAGIKVKAVKL